MIDINLFCEIIIVFDVVWSGVRLEDVSNDVVVLYIYWFKICLKIKFFS